jgi:hypothetical protein
LATLWFKEKEQTISKVYEVKGSKMWQIAFRYELNMGVELLQE